LQTFFSWLFKFFQTTKKPVTLFLSHHYRTCQDVQVLRKFNLYFQSIITCGVLNRMTNHYLNQNYAKVSFRLNLMKNFVKGNCFHQSLVKNCVKANSFRLNVKESANCSVLEQNNYLNGQVVNLCCFVEPGKFRSALMVLLTWSC